jgi:hypothetical protein
MAVYVVGAMQLVYCVVQLGVTLSTTLLTLLTSQVCGCRRPPVGGGGLGGCACARVCVCVRARVRGRVCACVFFFGGGGLSRAARVSEAL